MTVARCANSPEELGHRPFTDRLAMLSVTCRSLALLCTLDESWTATQIAPHFNPVESRTERSQAAWEGLLTRPAWNERVLAIIEPHFANIFATLSDDLRKAAVGVIANIAVQTPAHDGSVKHLVSVVISEGNENERAEWARSVGWLLRKISAESAHAAWDSWIPDYWKRRNDGVPRNLSAAETEEMLVWTTTAGHRFPEAVNLVTASDATFDRAYLFFKYIAGHQLLRDYPLETSRLVAFVLARCTVNPSPVCDEIGNVLQTLTEIHAEGSTVHLTAACDDAGRLDCNRALEWLRQIKEDK